ncbi:MAG TPA: hypothetical protein VH834_10800 [Solirubrobacteraceae bacterium]|jgi:hypothetical protein
MRSRQLLAYRFEPDATFQGQLVGALERIESGGAIRVLDILFVTRERDTGELTAVSLPARGTGDRTSRLLGFRLDAGERKAATRRALEGANAETIQALADVLEPGGAIAAILLEHAWADALGDAVARVGGAEAAAEFVEATALCELTERLLTAARA